MGAQNGQLGQGIQQGQGNQPQPFNQQQMQYGGGRPVGAGQGFRAPMPQFNGQAFQGGGMQPMGNQNSPQPGMNPYASGVPSTAQFVQQFQAQQAADAQQAQQERAQFSQPFGVTYYDNNLSKDGGVS